MIDIDHFLRRVDDPVFPDSGIHVQMEFEDMVVGGVAGGGDLDDPVGCACAASVCELIPVTDDADIRFDDGLNVLRQFNGKWGRVDLTRSFF